MKMGVLYLIAVTAQIYNTCTNFNKIRAPILIKCVQFKVPAPICNKFVPNLQINGLPLFVLTCALIPNSQSCPQLVKTSSLMCIDFSKRIL